MLDVTKNVYFSPVWSRMTKQTMQTCKGDPFDGVILSRKFCL